MWQSVVVSIGSVAVVLVVYTSMVLTEEQKERIRVNRERAMGIRREREEERRRIQTVEKESGAMGGFVPGSVVTPTEKKKKGAATNGATTGRGRPEGEIEEDEDDIELEEFERGASQFVSKKQAMKMYCLPDGTLSVCAFVEKSNPKQSTWSAMKLFHRSEIRRRARERYGGLEGLKEERERRELKRFERDFKCAEDIFEKKVKR